MENTEKRRLVVLGAGESGTGAAILAKDKGLDVFLSDSGTIAPRYRRQLEEEGKDITGLRERAEQIWKIEDFRERLNASEQFLRETYELPIKPDFPYTEPEDLDGIKAE